MKNNKIWKKIVLFAVSLVTVVSTLCLPTFASEANDNIYTDFTNVTASANGVNFTPDNSIASPTASSSAFCGYSDFTKSGSGLISKLTFGFSVSNISFTNKYIAIYYNYDSWNYVYTNSNITVGNVTLNKVFERGFNNVLKVDNVSLGVTGAETIYTWTNLDSNPTNSMVFFQLVEIAVFDSASERDEYVSTRDNSNMGGGTEDTTIDIESIYNEGYNEGYTEGFEEGAENGYYKGYDEGQSAGYNEGFTEGYEEGFSDGINEQIHSTITPTLSHFENAVIELYRGTKPPQTSNRYHTETVVSTTSPTNIFDMLYVPILDTSDGVYDGYTMTITFDDVVHFGENPFCLYLDTEEGYEFNLNDYLTVSFMSSSDEHFNLGDCFYNENGYYYYIPSKYIDSGDIDTVRITMKASLFAKLNDTSFSETVNLLTIVNKPYNVGIISGLILDRYYSNGYDMGYEDGNYDGYTEGKTNGYQLGYDEGYNLGYLASEGGEGFSSLFNGISHVPVTVLTSLLGFEVFGINLMGVFVGLLTILVVVFVIKRFI